MISRFWPILLILGALAAVYALGASSLLSWQEVAAHQAALRHLVATQPVTSGAGYVLVYALAVAASFPGAVIITVVGGLLFGVVLGAVLAVTGATLGASLLFLAARSALRPLLTARYDAVFARLRPGLEQDGFLYVLSLRLIPVVPFWLINLAASLSGIRFRDFVAGTALGIIPATTIFASIGAGVGTILAAGETPDLSLIASPLVLGPLLALAALSLLPIGWRRWKQRREN
jgi:uncharacterized membrane protein YdjX (TVP38/TMEM64 family)